MRTILRGTIVAMTALLLTACTYTPDKRAWTDIEYPTQYVQLEVMNAAGMSALEVTATREVLTKALNDLRIDISPDADRKVIVEVVGYNEQSSIASALRWTIEIVVGVPLAHWTTNELKFRSRLIMKDGRIVEFDKFAEINESGREFKHLQENMARRVAYAVFTAAALADAQERGYNQISVNK